MTAEIANLRTAIESQPTLHLTVAVGALCLAAVAGHFFVKFVLRHIARIVAPRLGKVAAEVIQDDGLFSRLAWYVPILIIYQGVGLLPIDSPSVLSGIHKIAVVAVIIVALRIVTRLMFKANEIYCRYPISRSRPIKGYLQVMTIILYIVCFILVIATAFDKSPLVFVSGLGAMTAVFLLVFRDTILSFVAGVQLTTNDLIRVGDWIEMPQFEADGDVIDIALNVVRVQNWDKTITVIPTHKFLEHSFKNWRGMSEAGGRRIKRTICVDVNTIRFLAEDEINQFGQFALLSEYIQRKKTELADYNRERDVDNVLLSNARRLTNVGTFRAYLINYLRQHPGIHQNMTFLVRQLQPQAEGLPLEIYVFTRDIRWDFYEGIQADIFDHILAVIPNFGLRMYQRPTGHDLRGLGNLATLREPQSSP